MWFLIVLLLLSLVANVALGYAFKRLTVRLFAYDDIFQYLVDDIEVNLAQFDRMSKSAILGNDTEIVAAHKNMMVMSVRLNEILQRAEENGGKILRTPTPLPRPVVV